MTIRDPELEPFYIGADEHFTIYETKIKSDGKKYYKPIGFFSSLPTAIKRIVTLKLGRNDNVVTLREYLQAYEDLVTILEHRVLSKLPTT